MVLLVQLLGQHIEASFFGGTADWLFIRDPGFRSVITIGNLNFHRFGLQTLRNGHWELVAIGLAAVKRHSVDAEKLVELAFPPIVIGHIDTRRPITPVTFYDRYISI